MKCCGTTASCRSRRRRLRSKAWGPQAAPPLPTAWAPTQERVRFVTREHIVGCADTDAEAAVSAPSLDDERRAARTEAAEARRFFDRLFDIAMSQPPQHADADCAEMDGLSGGVLG
jgi:hypothetical protein